MSHEKKSGIGQAEKMPETGVLFIDEPWFCYQAKKKASIKIIIRQAMFFLSKGIRKNRLHS